GCASTAYSIPYPTLFRYPRGECAPAPESGAPLPRSNEGVLRPLLGLRRIGREPQAQRVDATDVCAVQCFERRPIALLRAVDQIGDRKSTRLNSSHGSISY